MALHLSTVVARTVSPILTHISRLSLAFPNHPVVFAISSNAPEHHLSHLFHELTTFSSKSIGCLSSPLPGPYSALTACSLAILDPSHAVPFRSTIPGQPPSQVGRWHAPQRMKREVVNEMPNVTDWNNVWNTTTGMTRIPGHLEHLDSSTVSAVVYMTDISPEGLVRALSSSFPMVPKLGLVASSTPFVTGRPFTLFHNKDVFGSGAVGIALTRLPQGSFNTMATFANLTPLSTPMTVTELVLSSITEESVFFLTFSLRRGGNMIVSLDHQNPTQLLLSCLQNAGLSSKSFKDNMQFALGVINDDQLVQAFNITAGNPSRGAISLQAQQSPPQGATVQFLYRSQVFPTVSHQNFPFLPYHYSPTSDLSSSSGFFRYIMVDAELPLSPTETDMDPDSAYILDGTFLAASDNGFLLSTTPDNSWLCTFPGVSAALEFI
ncbi:hypothetical protein AMATHDRAFT_45552 [Amanita thiersii Skay4041]|uniref:FIST domain-containing protein n=1 Tax=Amanita thiersii Skay4041 TaxID=703135 RepID=A0A2A9NV77_9AGAR|nr:hypothetical protein AMATHDRAFT_45552 [Amanita thiersii Skay4041]